MTQGSIPSLYEWAGGAVQSKAAATLRTAWGWFSL